MAETKTTSKAAADEEIESIDDSILVKHLQGAHENPNIPRSVFVADIASATLKEDDYVSYTDASSAPGEGFANKSITVKAAKMKHAFDANGVGGGVGDWLVRFNNQWHVVKDADMK